MKLHSCDATYRCHRHCWKIIFIFYKTWWNNEYESNDDSMSAIRVASDLYMLNYNNCWECVFEQMWYKIALKIPIYIQLLYLQCAHDIAFMCRGFRNKFSNAYVCYLIPVSCSLSRAASTHTAQLCQWHMSPATLHMISINNNNILLAT